METTANFEAGLMAVYAEREQDGSLTHHERRIFARLKHHREHAIERIHRHVRHRYIKLGGLVDKVKGIDWTKVKDWLKANWPQIVQIILSIVFIFL